MQVDVVKIMDDIKSDIESKNISVADKFLATSYYKKSMKELKEQRQIVIVGAGYYGHRLFRMMEEEHIADKVVCFCDNNIEQQGKEYKGIGIISVVSAVIEYPDAYFVITPRNYENELVRQIAMLGISIDKVALWIFGNTGLVD